MKKILLLAFLILFWTAGCSPKQNEPGEPGPFPDNYRSLVMDHISGLDLNVLRNIIVRPPQEDSLTKDSSEVAGYSGQVHLSVRTDEGFERRTCTYFIREGEVLELECGDISQDE